MVVPVDVRSSRLLFTCVSPSNSFGVISVPATITFMAHWQHASAHDAQRSGRRSPVERERAQQGALGLTIRRRGVAEHFRDWGKRRAREERAEIKAVSDAILLLSKPLSGGPRVTAALTSLRKEYRVLLQRRWDRLRATARAEQWEMEAWCSRNVFRRHLVRKSSAITSLVNPNTGSLVETQDEVLEVARQFYKNLYAEPPPTTYSFPFTKTYEDFGICDTPLVEEEVFAALTSMNHNRSPGSDGLTVEFYVKFWKVLGKRGL
ncbi:hypothetical protein HPB51_024928 [Rhipicephalus microplus]|uniref:Uncharacterized protein n=1 Tax=Rhipicephalus microplus TaxID=6941 RepID=A0A9J6DDQ3_RHIMP|nr:hypothetical protein HPB51_024928 [Rhipicephalus microplus]